MVPHHAARVSYCPTQGALRRRGLTETPGGSLGRGHRAAALLLLPLEPRCIPLLSMFTLIHS